jgi:hypothetical protein
MAEYCVYVYMNVREGRQVMYRKCRVSFLVLLTDAGTDVVANYSCRW